jgi:hypothetical protein
MNSAIAGSDEVSEPLSFSPKSPSRRLRWVGRILSALPILGLLLSASMKLTHAPAFVETWTGHLGFSEAALTPIGILELACTLVYVLPRTSALGAVLLTGYLGGAVVTHVRVGDPFVAPLVFGLLLWAGLSLRDGRVRDALLTRRQRAAHV